jgi:apolipoprotein N-acyltransferase
MRGRFAIRMRLGQSGPLDKKLLQKVISTRYPLAIAGGLLLALSFPKPGLAGLAWIAPGVILFAALGARGEGSAFRIGYVAGLAHFLVSLYWFVLIPFPLGAVAAWLAISFYMALYPALWVWLCWRIFPGARMNGGNGGEGLERFAAIPLHQRLLWAVGCAILWVALEMMAARFLTGFPWNFLGVSQYEMVPLTQIASVTGVYGVSFLVAWFSVALASAGAVLLAQPSRFRLALGDVTLPLLAVVLTGWHGFRQIPPEMEPERTLKVAMVQPSIPQTLIWDPNENSNRFNFLIELSHQALSTKPDLLVWPEASVPDLMRYNIEAYQTIRQMVVDHGVWMILGADDANLKAGSKNELEFYNSSFIIDPQGRIRGDYRKRRLVVFGEYIPLVRWFPFMKYLSPIGEGFTPGESFAPFHLEDWNANASILICFEDVFPHLAREYVNGETDFFLNLTNNGWFGESAAQWQHAANAVFRAIENRTPLIRCANNGLTCWVDPYGRMREVYMDADSKDIYGPGFKTAEIPLRGEGELRSLSFYTRYGDVFGWSCVGLALLLVGAPFVSRRAPFKMTAPAREPSPVSG